MKFWIRINGLQEGPMEIDQMKDYNITPTTYVWCAGMKDWAYARDVEDLKDVISTRDNGNTENTGNTPNPDPQTAQEGSEQEGLEQKEPQDNAEESPSAEKENAEPANAELASEEPATEEKPASEPSQQAAPASTIVTPQPTSAPQPKDERPCPTNNLIWAILATIFCCQITGLIAIIFAAQVSSKYESDGYDEAKKYSDRAGWWCIISIVAAILSYSIFIPLALLGEML